MLFFDGLTVNAKGTAFEEPIGMCPFAVLRWGASSAGRQSPGPLDSIHSRCTVPAGPMPDTIDAVESGSLDP